MLNIKEKQSVNNVEIIGTLSELSVEPKKTGDGRAFVSAEATIKVDQDINGKVTENEIPVRFFAMQLKGDGEPNKNYKTICEFPTKFKSLAACGEENKDEATKVILSSAHLEESTWVDPNGGAVKNGFKVGSSFMNAFRASDEFIPTAKFELTGVVLGKAREVNGNDEETGRLKVKFAIVRYQGRVEILNLIAETPAAVDFIESNWAEGDTVKANGAIRFRQTTKTWMEEQGFGEPIKRVKVETCKELIILGGSNSGLEEAFSYDNTDIRVGLQDRNKRIEEQKNGAGKKPAASSAQRNTSSFGDFAGF